MDDASLLDAADQLGTPLYVYDGDAVVEAAERLRAAFSRATPTRLFYSAKANAAVGVASLMREAGMGFEACSPGDLRLAELAGFTPAEITYTGYGASDAELATAARSAGTLVLDALDEVDRLAALGIRRPIGLRLNPAIRAGFHAHVSAGAEDAKFGLRAGDLGAALAAATRVGLAVQGLHAHAGSDVLEAEVHLHALRVLVEAASELPDITWVNVGGGLGTPRRADDRPYRLDTLATEADRMLTLPDGRRLELRLEPGAHCLMDAGVVLGRVVAVRPADAGRPATAVVDASTNQLVSILLYGALHPPHLLSRTAIAETDYRVTGNLMQAGDVLAERARLPELRAGDVLAFPHAGAYAAGRSTTFNERPPAAEALVRAGRLTLLRRHGTLDELFARDVVASCTRPPRG